MKKTRNANIELLRIISIFLIIGHLCYSHSGLKNLTNINSVFLKITGSGSSPAIACLILMAVFWRDRKKPGRVISSIKDRWIYSFLITASLLLIGRVTETETLTFKSLFPLITCRHNYITAFCMLYLFIPSLNKFISRLSRDGIEKFIINTAILFSVIPTIVPGFANNTNRYFLGMFIFYIIYLYEYDFLCKLILLLSVFFEFLCLFLIEPGTSYAYKRIVYLQYIFPNLLIPICLFKIFFGIHIKNRNLINWLSESTFAVYKFHDDSYLNIIQTPKFARSYFLPVHFFCTVVIKYISFICIDKILRNTLFRITDKFPFVSLQNKTKQFYASI